MSSQQPGAVNLLVSSEVSRVSGGDERRPVAQAVKFAEIEKSLRELRSGRMIVIADDEDRENEGDLVIAAEMVTPEVINFMATYARGLICLAMTGERLDQLELGPMVFDNTARWSHKIDHFRSDHLCRDHEVTFILTMLIIGNDDHAP